MKNLFRFLHIINIIAVVITLTMHFFSKGLMLQFWLGFYQLSVGFIQLASTQFFTSKTKKIIALYWGSVFIWFVVYVSVVSLYPVLRITLLIAVPMAVACYSVYVSWHTLKDITKRSDEEKQ